MKKTVLFLFLYVSLGFLKAQNYTVCSGGPFTVHAVNSSSLANPVFSVTPGGTTNTTGSFVVVISSSTLFTFTLYVTGTNSSSAIETTSTVVNVQGTPWPYYDIVSSAMFTLGCGTKSAVTASLTNITPSTAVSFTWLTPGTSTLLSGVLSSNTVYTLTVAGTHTAVVRNDMGGCETRIPVNIQQNMQGPTFYSVVTSPGISCINPTVSIKAYAKGENFVWQLPNQGPPLTGSSVVVSVPGTYTLEAVEPISRCAGQTVVVIPDERADPTLLTEDFYSLCNTPSVLITATLQGEATGATWKWTNLQGQLIATDTFFVATKAGIYFCQVINQKGCFTIRKLIVTDCTVLPEWTSASTAIWPNPVTDYLNFLSVSSGIQRVVLYDAMLRNVCNLEITGSGIIDMRPFPKGIYLVQIDGKIFRVIRE